MSRGNNNSHQRNKGGSKGEHQAIATKKWRVNQESSEIVCYYCHEPAHTKHIYRHLQCKNQQAQSAHVAFSNTTNVSPSEKNILVFADEFAQFSQYQTSLKSNDSPITAITESGKSNTSSSLFIKMGY